MSSSLMLRYWSTDFRVPRIEMSFFSSTVKGVLVRVLKKLSFVRPVLCNSRVSGQREVSGKVQVEVGVKVVRT